VAAGGVITFNCGREPVTITLTAAAKVMNTTHRVVLDGGGLVTLSGGGRHRILYLNTCDHRQIITTDHCYDQRWPSLVVQNITLADGYSSTRQTPGVHFGGGGGGAIFDLGGQLKVVNSRFTGNRCFPSGPDLGGGAIRALSQWEGLPVYITYDTFTGGRCSNGGALSSIGVSWQVFNSVMTGNQAIGFGANPPLPGTPGGGSGGAIYTDGNTYRLVVQGTRFTGNYAREGGGAIFFVSNDHTGGLVIRNSSLAGNPSGVFWTRLYPGVYFHCLGHRPKVVNSTFR
jgi:predicted outer membrane repeat protein